MKYVNCWGSFILKWYLLYFLQTSVQIQSNSLQDKADIAQIISAVLIGCLTIISVIVSVKAFKDGKVRKSRERAVDLAHFYQQEIIPEIDYVCKVFKGTGALKVLNSLDLSKFVNFDREELESLLGDKITIEDIKILISQIPVENLRCAKDYLDKKSTKLSNSKKADEKDLRDELFENLNTILNTFEWFSMNFTTGVADESVIYQSLHQTFISNIYLLYFFISTVNNTECDKYYINMIELFNIWRDRKIKVKEKEDKNKSEFESNQQILTQMNRIKYQSKKRKVPYTAKPLK